MSNPRIYKSQTSSSKSSSSSSSTSSSNKLMPPVRIDKSKYKDFDSIETNKPEKDNLPKFRSNLQMCSGPSTSFNQRNYPKSFFNSKMDSYEDNFPSVQSHSSLADISTSGMSKISFAKNCCSSSSTVINNDVEMVQQTSEASSSHKVEQDGIAAQQSATYKNEKRSMKIGEVTQEENRTRANASRIVKTPNSSTEFNTSNYRKQQDWKNNDTVTSSHVTAASGSTLEFTNPSPEIFNFDFDRLGWESSTVDVNRVMEKYNSELSHLVDSLKHSDEECETSISNLEVASKMIKSAWRLPGHGNQVGHNICETFKNIGGIDILIENFQSDKGDLKVASARLLEQSLTPEICNYVVEKGYDCLDKVVKVASELCEANESGIGMGLMRQLFRHSESTCSDVLRLQGLDLVKFECRRRDEKTLRNCAMALVNLSLFGGPENHEAIIKEKVHLWLFPLALNDDPLTKYYACLAIAILAANKEIQVHIIKSNTLELVESFLNSHDPETFAATHATYIQGQSKEWLEKLIPVLKSQRKESCSIAAFHFCMEAGIKKRTEQEEIFKRINAIEPLKLIASSPNPLASKFAGQALRLIGETIPHKLSQKVPLWSVNDVLEWVIQKGFDEFVNLFVDSRVDGDLLLQLTDEMLKADIKISNGILRKRFMREVQNLKKLADYSSCDSTNLKEFLTSIHPEFSTYTYTFLKNDVDKEMLIKNVSEEFLIEAGVELNIHRLRFLSTLNAEKSLEFSSTPEKPVDVFISYRRSNGSQLASLLKVHLTMKGFDVFIDFEKLECGKFDTNLLKNIRAAKNFILVLTPNALDRCIGDNECKDWVHKEIVTALSSQCNIIPVMDNFVYPNSEVLPLDMQSALRYHGINWIHDYQDACVDKIEKFIR